MGTLRYIYDGPVVQFGVVIAEHWYGETIASSEARARANLAYRFKVLNNRIPAAKISLPGKLFVIDEQRRE